MFKKEGGDWTEYRELDNLIEIDYHHGDEIPEKSYWENMQDTYDGALNILKKHASTDTEWVMFTHGWSTSRIGKTTNRSQIRKLMRSKDATPYIVRKESIQHHSVFVAKLKK